MIAYMKERYDLPKKKHRFHLMNFLKKMTPIKYIKEIFKNSNRNLDGKNEFSYRNYRIYFLIFLIDYKVSEIS